MVNDELIAEARNLRRDVAALVGMAQQMEAGTELAERAQKIERDTSALSDRLTAEASKVQAHEVLNHRFRRFVLVLAAVVVCLMMLAGFAGCNAYRIGQIQDRTSNGVLCPVWQLMLDSYRPEAVPDEEIDRYEHAFAVLRESYALLECSQSSK